MTTIDDLERRVRDAVDQIRSEIEVNRSRRAATIVNLAKVADVSRPTLYDRFPWAIEELKALRKNQPKSGLRLELEQCRLENQRLRSRVETLAAIVSEYSIEIDKLRRQNDSSKVKSIRRGE